MNIYEKLMNIRSEFLELDINKSGNNTYSHFKYYELKDFLPTATRKFTASKLYSKFSVIPATTNEVEKAIFVIVNSENPEEVEEYVIPTAECFIGRKANGTGGADPIQNLGGKITYLRRYMYLIVLDLIEDDSVDNQDTSNRNYNTSEQKTPLGELNEKEATEEATKIGLANMMKSLSKEENIEFKDIVVKAILTKIGFKEWDDIKFSDELTYKMFTELVVAELQKQKDLKEIGI